MAMELVDCSGEHKDYNRDAKICLIESLNIKNGNKEGYYYLKEQAGTKPPSWIGKNRPDNYPLCTKQIIKELIDSKSTTMSREVLRDIILKIGYPETTFHSAIKSLEKQKKSTIGDPRSRK